MWETDKGLAQIHVTFFEHFVFQECKRILYITLAKYLGQENITGYGYISGSYILLWPNIWGK